MHNIYILFQIIPNIYIFSMNYFFYVRSIHYLVAPIICWEITASQLINKKAQSDNVIEAVHMK